VILALILLACALLVYLRVPVYLSWRAEGAKGRVLRVARDGLLGGGAVALLSLLSPGEPSIQPGLSDRLIGISDRPWRHPPADRSSAAARRSARHTANPF
jgi:hypothetical protein